MALKPSINPITFTQNYQPSNKSNSKNYLQSTYHQPEPTNTFRVNPLVFSSMKNLDIDHLQESFGKVLQDQNLQDESIKLERQRVCAESEEIKALKTRIKSALINQDRAHQIYEGQNRRMQDLVKDSEIDEKVLSNLERERQLEYDNQMRKRQERFQAKYVLQEQMKDKEKLKAESMKEYLRDKDLVNDAVNQIREEDIATYEDDQRKKAVQKFYMENSYAEKAERKQKEKQDEEMRKEAERRYFEEVANRERENQMKKVAKQDEKDKIFEQLCRDKEQQKAEKDYWENIRNDLYHEEEKRKNRLTELEEKEKKQRQKEEMLQWAIEQMKIKELRKKEEEKMEAEFKKKLQEKYAEGERLEQYNAIRRKQKELDLRAEIEKQWKLKLEQYQQQKERELSELENAKKVEMQKRIIIEEEKARLIKENEDVLKNFYAKGYFKSITGLLQNQMSGNNNQNINNNLNAKNNKGGFNMSPLSSFSSK